MEEESKNNVSYAKCRGHTAKYIQALGTDSMSQPCSQADFWLCGGEKKIDHDNKRQLFPA